MPTASHLPAGRGPTGRRRNFAAMSDLKLARTLGQLSRNAHGDLDALHACRAAASARGLAPLTRGPIPARSR